MMNTNVVGHDDALLCCWQVWSSGRIAHIPLYYVPRTLIGRSQDAPFVKQLPTPASLFTT